jgi:hypothetical protein
LVCSTATIGLAGWMASVGLVPREVILYTGFGWAVPAGILILLAHAHAVQVRRQFGDKIRAFVYQPTPIGSLVESLNSQDVATADLKHVMLMSADLEEGVHYYLEGDDEGVSLVRMLEKNPDLTVSVYGPSKNPNVKSPHERMSLLLTTGVGELTEHKNLILTKDGQKFVWYEPYHNVVNGHHYFNRGAYLVEIDELVQGKIQNEYDELRLGAATSATIDEVALSTYRGATERAQVGVSLASREGDMMRTQQSAGSHPEVGFEVFKVGLLVMIVGWASWLIFLTSNEMAFALGASVMAAIGANILMLGVLGGRGGEEAKQIQQS